MSKGFKNNSKIDKDKKEMGNKVCCQNSNNESSQTASLDKNGLMMK